MDGTRYRLHGTDHWGDDISDIADVAESSRPRRRQNDQSEVRSPRPHLSRGLVLIHPRDRPNGCTFGSAMYDVETASICICLTSASAQDEPTFHGTRSARPHATCRTRIDRSSDDRHHRFRDTRPNPEPAEGCTARALRVTRRGDFFSRVLARGNTTEA